MRTFDYRNLPQRLFDREVGDATVRLYEDKGKLEVLRKVRARELAALEERAHADNVDASTRIEGVCVDFGRVRELCGGARPSGDAEAQVAGYSRALATVEGEWEGLELSTSTIVRLYEELCFGRDLGLGSRYRKKDYVYTQVDGHMRAVAVSPVPAFETPLVLGGACDSLAGAFDAQRCSPLVLAAVFTVDLLCIRPFDEYNGRVARLFADLLLRKAGFDISRFSSVERVIERDAAAYYDALNACVEGWDAGRADYAPFALYWLDALHLAYEELFSRVDVEASGVGKEQRVRRFVERAGAPVSKKDVLDACPDVSVSTVENALGKLVKEGAVRKLGAGRATRYEAVR